MYFFLPVSLGIRSHYLGGWSPSLLPPWPPRQGWLLVFFSLTYVIISLWDLPMVAPLRSTLAFCLYQKPHFGASNFYLPLSSKLHSVAWQPMLLPNFSPLAFWRFGLNGSIGTVWPPCYLSKSFPLVVILARTSRLFEPMVVVDLIGLIEVINKDRGTVLWWLYLSSSLYWDL